MSRLAADCGRIPSVLVGNREARPSGSDSGGLLADLLEGARRRDLSANSLAAYERTWTRFLARTAAASFDPRSLPFPAASEAYRFLEEGKNAASPQTDPGRAFLCLQALGLEKPFCEDRAALQKEPQSAVRTTLHQTIMGAAARALMSPLSVRLTRMKVTAVALCMTAPARVPSPAPNRGECVVRLMTLRKLDP
jgi:hypothetical protein